MSEFDSLLSRMDAEGMGLPLTSDGIDGDGLCVRIEENKEQPAYETQSSSAVMTALNSVIGDQGVSGVGESVHLPSQPFHGAEGRTEPNAGTDTVTANQTEDSIVPGTQQADSHEAGMDGEALPEKRRAVRREGDIEIFDPTFPAELIEEQEDFIFSVSAKKETPAVPAPNKWEKYALRVYKLSRTLARKSKTILRKDGDQRSVFGFQIFTLKQRIKTVLNELVQEYGNDTRFPDLEAGNEEEDMVNVEEVVCSKCGLSDTPENDILLCDKQGCCRAYHQNCLDPPVDPAAIKDEAYWFCWVCDTINNCLAWINTKLGTNFEKPEDVFPDLDSEAAQWEGKYPPDFYDPEKPSPIGVKDESKVTRRRSKVVESSSESEGTPVVLNSLRRVPKLKSLRAGGPGSG